LIVLTFAGTVVGSLLQSRRIALADKRRALAGQSGVQAD